MKPMMKLILKYVSCASFRQNSHDDVEEFHGGDDGSCPHKKFIWLKTINPSAKCKDCGWCYFSDEQRWCKVTHT